MLPRTSLASVIYKLFSTFFCKNKYSSFIRFILYMVTINPVAMKVISQKILCPVQTLQLKSTLAGGQCFRWKEVGENKWRGVFANKVWTLWNDGDYLHYETEAGMHASPETATMKNGSELLTDEFLLRQYLQLDVPLDKLYSEWSENDSSFKTVSKDFPGVRILKQDVVENIFSFICSSNNNIIRISSMVEKLCNFYGEEIAVVDGIKYNEFPRVTALADPAVETKLRNSGFGYRAKFIQQSAAKIVALGEEEWLTDLQKLPYTDAKKELMKLTGIGAKVADCICLMSLNHLEAVPVDTHVFQIAQRYLPHLRKVKTVTDKVYNEIGDYFRSLYGAYAGWAHTILFCADLKKFREDSQAEVTVQTGKRVKSDTTCGKKRKVAPEANNGSKASAKNGSKASAKNGSKASVKKK